MRKSASVQDKNSCRLLVCIIIVLFCAQTIAAGRGRAAENNDVVFDLRPQPLSEALEAYSVATGRLVLYDGHLTIGRVSADVRGSFAPDIALQLILKNTGLVARYTADDAFIIAPAQTETAASRTPTAIASAALSTLDTGGRNYYAIVQASVGAALCSKSQTRPGQYRLALQFRIDGSGNIARPNLLSSTGDAERDTAVIDIIGHTSIAEPPPVNLAQPFIVVVLPRTSGGGIDCPPSRNPGRDG